MKYLKTYQLFESKTGLTQEQEKFLNMYTEGTWTYNPATELVDVKGNFDCSKQKRKSLSGVRFGKVSGDFYCENNNLTSLEGAPKEVDLDFNCRYNSLTSLEGAPQVVGRNFYCGGNELTSLKGAPKEVGGWFSCDAFRFKRGQWNLKGWLKALKEGIPKTQQLIATLLTPEMLNKEIQKDPAGMVMNLKEIWNDEGFRETRAKLVWPKDYEKEAHLLGDLDDVGF